MKHASLVIFLFICNKKSPVSIGGIIKKQDFIKQLKSLKQSKGISKAYEALAAMRATFKKGTRKNPKVQKLMQKQYLILAHGHTLSLCYKFSGRGYRANIRVIVSKDALIRTKSIVGKSRI